MNKINEILQSRFIDKNDKPRFIYKLIHLRYKNTNKSRYYKINDYHTRVCDKYAFYTYDGRIFYYSLFRKGFRTTLS